MIEQRKSILKSPRGEPVRGAGVGGVLAGEELSGGCGVEGRRRAAVPQRHHRRAGPVRRQLQVGSCLLPCMQFSLRLKFCHGLQSLGAVMPHLAGPVVRTVLYVFPSALRLDDAASKRSGRQDVARLLAGCCRRRACRWAARGPPPSTGCTWSSGPTCPGHPPSPRCVPSCPFGELIPWRSGGSNAG